MNKRDLIRQYGTWIVLITAYLGFHFLKNHAWIEEHDITSSEISSLVQPATSDKKVSSRHLERKQNQKTSSSSDISHLKEIDTLHPVNKNKTNSQTRSHTRSVAQTPIRINQASQEEWQTLNGIGEYRSERIIRFRSALGGFYSIDQVAETYGLPDTIYEYIRPFLRMDSSFQKIKVNHMPYDSLYQHPYITKQMAYFIARHREKQAPITKMAQMYGIIKEKDHERLNKLEPYLDFSIE